MIMAVKYETVCYHTVTEREIVRHNETRPFAPENGKELKFKKGDAVIYTNDYGAEFEHIVTGHYQPEKVSALYASGHRYLLNMDCHWMPVREINLRAT